DREGARRPGGERARPHGDGEHERHHGDDASAHARPGAKPPGERRHERERDRELERPARARGDRGERRLREPVREALEEAERGASGGHRGGKARRSAMGPASSAIPAVAATDSWKPTAYTSVGFSARSTSTAPPTMAGGLPGRPRNTPSIVSVAMAAARSTDG